MSESQGKKLYYIRGQALTLHVLCDAVKTMLYRDIASSLTTYNLQINGKNALASRVTAIDREVAHFFHRQRHDLQIRSVPIDTYANVFRHFYLRVNEIVEVHPGTEQRISLRGWHDAVDLGSDRLEQRCITCARCADGYLAACWRESHRFNLVTRNCDQSFNGSAQSFAAATFIALLVCSFSCIGFSRTRRFMGVLMLVTLLLFAVIQCVVSTFNDALGMPEFVEPVGTLALGVIFCPHIFHNKATTKQRIKAN